MKATDIKVAQIVRDDKGNDVVAQAFLEHEQPPNAAIAVAERVYLLEGYVKRQDIVYPMLSGLLIFTQQAIHFFFYSFGRGRWRIQRTNHVFVFLVFAD